MFEPVYRFEGGRPSLSITMNEFEFDYEGDKYVATRVDGGDQWLLRKNGAVHSMIYGNGIECVHSVVKPEWWLREGPDKSGS